MYAIMSCTGAADWRRWASETLTLRTEQLGKGLYVQHLLSASIHFTFDPIQSRVHTQNRFSKRERFYFFLIRVSMQLFIQLSSWRSIWDYMSFAFKGIQASCISEMFLFQSKLGDFNFCHGECQFSLGTYTIMF